MISNFLFQYNSQPNNNDDQNHQHNDHNFYLYFLQTSIQCEALDGLIILQVEQYLSVYILGI